MWVFRCAGVGTPSPYIVQESNVHFFVCVLQILTHLVLTSTLDSGIFKKNFFLNLFIYDSHREREREAETQAEGEAGSMHREPDVGFDPGSPGSRPGPKAGAKPLRHPGIPLLGFLNSVCPKWT